MTNTPENQAHSAPCALLPWDTHFFGFPIARVGEDTLTQEQIQQIDRWCDQTGVRCLYFLGRADEADTTRLAENNGFQFVDIRLTFGYKVHQAMTEEINKSQNLNPKSKTQTVLIRPARPEDIHALQTMARQGYYDTRFYFDANFPRHLTDLLYETWIKLSCEGYAQAVLVAELDKVPVGYISCHQEEQAPCRGKIGLVGVSQQAQGQGVGQNLVLSALAWFLAQGVTEVQVVTQGRNIAAQRLYQRSGFLTQAVQLWYHKWYPYQGGRS